MKAKNDIPHEKFTLALEATRNLLLPALDEILQGGWSAALAANSEIKIRPISQRTGPFHRHLVPLLKDLAALLAGTYRRYFKLALAHPQQSGPDPHEWALHQLDAPVGVTLEWISNWYILACDGSNQYMQLVTSVPFEPGRTVSTSIPLNPTEIVSPESWRAPAWLFAVGPVVGIGRLKQKNVPPRDSEEKLSAAHTRLLLKGARRVFLWKLGAEIETVRNEEVAAAGAIPPPTMTLQTESNKRKGSKREFKGTEGLGQKKADLSRYMLDMTDKQRLAFSLKYEYELRLTEIASRMGIDRTTAREHLDAANKRLEQNRAFEKRKANRSKNDREE
jgi:DNA-directed RNA polymerase specialized sigma24 family protein